MPEDTVTLRAIYRGHFYGRMGTKREAAALILALRALFVLVAI